MHQKTKDLQKRYDGFLQTSTLWKGNDVFSLNQFNINKNYLKIDIEIDEKLRLGKYIERLVSFQLSKDIAIRILCENIQIQQNKRTLGELDCIIQQAQKYIHLEIIYKFYLFDKSVGTTEIGHFIGPNRKDTLIEKLSKLKEKQLPLLYSKECKSYLDTINLKSSELEQQVYFKAQLFVPYANRNKITLHQLNKNCVRGFYINQNDLKFFIDCKFYIPLKKDWIITPHKNVDWVTFKLFQKESKDYIDRKFSPLCWIKKPNGEIEKFFLIWW